MSERVDSVASAAPDGVPAPVAAPSRPKGAAVDTATLTRLFQEHHALVRRLVARLGAHPSEVDDIVQEVFLELVGVRLPDSFDVSERAFVASVARNVVLRHRRGLFRRIRNAMLAADLERARTDTLGPEWSIDVRTVASILESLSEAQRTVFVLMELEEWSAPEVSACLEVPLNTVYSRQRAARLAFEAARSRLLSRERKVL